MPCLGACEILSGKFPVGVQKEYLIKKPAHLKFKFLPGSFIA
jgi:hypothetical protein